MTKLIDFDKNLVESLTNLGFSHDDASFLADMCLTAYNQNFNNDKALNEDFKFGFSDLSQLIEAYLEVLDRPSDIVDIENNIQNNIVAILRKDVSKDDYIKNNLIEEDRRLYKLLTINDDKDSEDDDLIEYINTNHAYKTLVDSVCEVVCDVYTCLFQDGYGLNPYKGVIIIKDPTQYTARVEANKTQDSFLLNAIPNAATAFGDISKILDASLNITTNRSSRQFNIHEMINSSIPVYYPAKILEYASGLETLNKQDKIVYRKHAKNKSWGKYFENSVDNNGDLKQVELDGYYDEYIKPSIKSIIEKSICYVFKKHIDLKKSAIEQSDLLGSNEMLHEVRIALNRVQASLCTALVIVDYNSLGGKVNSIVLRVVETSATLPTDSSFTKSLFGKLSTNQNIVFNDANIISDEVQGKNLAYRVIEYKHDFDSALTNAEPMFGYKAVELYKERGINISWDKILLGKDTKGTPIFASVDDPQDLHLQLATVHNMMAGSRAGKGVMTMNILASAIASGKPLFYIDRKPDMAVMFYKLTKGNMFLVNGGQFLGKNDPENYFADDGVAVSGWDYAYDNMPKYLKEIFSVKSYNGDFGDYVYYRAIMFIFGLLMARVEVPSSIADLGGEDGIAIVIDEFKNWQTIFENKFFSITGVFCKTDNRIIQDDEDKYENLEIDIKTKQAQLDQIMNDAKKQAQATKLQLEIEAKRNKQQKLINEKKAYCSTIISKFGESVKHMAEQFSAGFKDSEGRKSDIFVIGQNIEINGYFGASNNTGVYSVISTGAYNNNNETKNSSLMRGLLNNFPVVDWIMGYNQDIDAAKSYMGCDVDKQSKHWIVDNQYWGYIQGASMESLRTSKPEGTRFFKPYLVLNNNKEDDPKNPEMSQVKDKDGTLKTIESPEYAFVRQCRDRVNDAVPGAELWEKVRLKHLPKEYALEAEQGTNKHYGALNEGIGFEGLIKLIKDGNVDFNTELVESRNIADRVAKNMGYSNYLELLFDFSPKGIFSTKDIVNAISGKVSFNNLEMRLPLFAKYGFIDGLNDTEIDDFTGSDAFDFDSDFDDDNIDYTNQTAQSSQTANQTSQVTTQPYNSNTSQVNIKSQFDYYEKKSEVDTDLANSVQQSVQSNVVKKRVTSRDILEILCELYPNVSIADALIVYDDLAKQLSAKYEFV